MKLIIGLGNPEPSYDKTRHNIGFLLLDGIVKRLGGSWQVKPKFKASLAETIVESEKVLFAKPSTYYNLSGEAVKAIVDFYKLDPAVDVLVLHDELALPFGTLRTRHSGSDAGNNGIKNIIAHLGEQFARIRVGIASESAPSHDAADFVLSRFTNEELAQIDHLSQHAFGFVENFIHQDKEFSPTSVRI
jgi:peptidyl-tRNA hydrolase, PTH1 family